MLKLLIFKARHEKEKEFRFLLSTPVPETDVLIYSGIIMKLRILNIETQKAQVFDMEVQS